MTTYAVKSTVGAFKEESSEGTYTAPSAGDFVSLASITLNPAVETVTSPELVNSLGESKGFITKQSPTGSVEKLLKHSGVEGTAPEYGILIESALGSVTANGTEYATTGASSAGTSAARGYLTTTSYSNFVKGQGLLIKDSTLGYEVRNVYSTDTNKLNLSFNTASAVANPTNLGKAVHYKTAVSGHPTFTAHMHQASSDAAFKAAVTGCRTTNLSMSFVANDLARLSASFGGIKFLYNHIVIDNTNNKINFNEGGSELIGTVTNGVYLPHELARELEVVMDALATADITVTFSDTTGKFTLASAGATFQLLWKTGTNGSDNTDTHIGSILGFVDSANDTGAVTYTSDNEQDYDPAVTPSYDSEDGIVVKDVQLQFGSFDQYVCRAAVEFTVNVDTPKEDAPSFCAETGIDSTVFTGRTVTGTGSMLLPKHDAGIIDKMLNNTTISLAMNAGDKSNGNWTAGTITNIFFPNCTVQSYELAERSSYYVLNFTVKAFVDASQDDVHINYL